MIILPLPSRYPPVKGFHPPVNDFRKETTAWKALVWAYADEHVRAATHCGGEPVQYCSNGLRMMRVGETGIGRGSINGVLDVHEDAIQIDGLVARWFDQWPAWRNMVAVYAERKSPPPRLEQLRPLRVVGPARDDRGKPLFMWDTFGRRDNPIACVVRFEGCTPQQVKAHAEFLALFEAMMDRMVEMTFKKWKVVSRGY